MSQHTMVNLREVEDMAPKFGYAPDLESRFARKALELEKSGVSYYRVAPGFRLPFGHTHSEQEEVYLVVTGSMRVRIGNDIVDLGPFDAVRVAPGAIRGFEAGRDGAELVAFGAPNTDNQDAEMQPDWWSD